MLPGIIRPLTKSSAPLETIPAAAAWIPPPGSGKRNHPRALILSTGEEIPKGQSVRARLLILELSKGAITVERLTDCQRNAATGRYADAMAGFLQWLAGRYESQRERFSHRAQELRVPAMQTRLTHEPRTSSPAWPQHSKLTWNSARNAERSMEGCARVSRKSAGRRCWLLPQNRADTSWHQNPQNDTFPC